jgi:hypothetical protein
MRRWLAATRVWSKTIPAYMRKWCTWDGQRDSSAVLGRGKSKLGQWTRTRACCGLHPTLLVGPTNARVVRLVAVTMLDHMRADELLSSVFQHFVIRLLDVRIPKGYG